MVAGTHVVEFTAKGSVDLEEPGSDGRNPGFGGSVATESRGVLSISVANANDVQLNSILSRLDDYALCATPSPAVLPYLSARIRAHRGNCALVALVGFEGNKQAEAIALELLDSERTAVEGVCVAADLHVAIPMEEVAPLLNGSRNIKAALLQYAMSAKFPQYLDVAEKLQQDPDPDISKLASRAVTALTGH